MRFAHYLGVIKMKMGNYSPQMAIIENEIVNKEKNRKRIAELEKEIEARCENDKKSIHYLHEELEALKQWQREAVKFLPLAKDDLQDALRHDPFYKDEYEKEVAAIEALIKQAEENEK